MMGVRLVIEGVYAYRIGECTRSNKGCTRIRLQKRKEKEKKRDSRSRARASIVLLKRST